MEAALDRLVAHSFTLARVSGWICGLLLTVSAFVIGLDIALRQIFVVTIGGANELAGYALAVSSSWGCTVALVHRIHVRIDSVYTHLSARIRAALDIIGLAAFIYFLAFVTFYAWKVLEQSIESNTHSISALGRAARDTAGGLVRGLCRVPRRRLGLSAARHARLRQRRPAPRARAARRALDRGGDGVREGEPRPRTAGRPMTLVAILVLLLILVLAVPVAAGLGWLGLVLNQFYSPISLIVTTGEVTWSTTTSFILVAVPFYVLMGEIMLRTGMAERMYAAIAQWVSWLPGGLMHSNVVACAVWGAPSGSSVATAVTVGTVAIGEIKKHNYNEPLFLGTIAAGGTLGILIPPSINMVVYGAMTDTSIPKLYLAGFIPGFVLSILFMATVLIACLWRPAWGGTPVVTSWEARIRTLPGLLPPLVILAAVIGSIYIGWATATEAAALGILAAFAYAAYERSLSMKVIGEIFEGTARTTGMIMAIVIGAYFLNVVITTIGLPNQIGTLVKSLDLSPFGTLMLIIVFYLILGMFMETLSMMVATIPITTPIIVQAGYDPVWYGILVVLLMEAALLTPPVGMNLFVVQGIRERGDLNDVIVGTLPFIVTLFVMIGLIVAFPGIAMWLPNFLN